MKLKSPFRKARRKITFLFVRRRAKHHAQKQVAVSARPNHRTRFIPNVLTVPAYMRTRA